MGSSWSEVFLTFQATHSRTSLPHTNINFFSLIFVDLCNRLHANKNVGCFQMSHFANDCFANVSSQFANVQKSVYKVQKSVCKCYQHLYVQKSVHTLCRFEMSTLSIQTNPLARSYSFVVDFALSQHLRVACTVAVTHKSIYQ